MAGFRCKHCSFDLSLRIDVLVKAMQADYPDGEFPEDVAIDGCCDECRRPFQFGGRMFSKFLSMKAEEGILDPRTKNFAIIEFDINNEEADWFRELISGDNKEELQAFIAKLMIRDERPDRED